MGCDCVRRAHIAETGRWVVRTTHTPLRRLSGAARIKLTVGEEAGLRWLDVELFTRTFTE